MATCGEVVHDSWLAVKAVHSLFGTSANHAIENYKRFVEEGIDTGSPWEQLRGQICLGSDHFVGDLESKLDGYAFDRDIVQKQRHPCRPQINDVLNAVMQRYKMDRESLLNRRNKEPFRLVVFLLRRVCNVPLKDVASMAGISEGRVCQIHRAMRDADVSEEVRDLLEKFNV